MSLQFCKTCKKFHTPGEGYYWGPTYACTPGEPTAEDVGEGIVALMARVAQLENDVWALQTKLSDTEQ